MLKPFRDRLADGVVVCDGAMGTQLYAKGVFINRCFDELNLTHPALVREVHQEYVWSGAEVLETNTFGANRIKLEPHGLAEQAAAINAAGVALAREVGRGLVYIAGSVGPLGVRIEPFGKMTAAQAQAVFREQIKALAEAGVDLIALETFADLHELRSALAAAREVCELPVMAQIALSDEGNSLDGAPPEIFARQLEDWGADVVGVNCGVGPQVMLDTVERIAQVVSRPVVAQPNAGKPRNFEGRNLYLSSPEYVASYAKRFIRAGARVVGGCCGTTPAHIKAIRETVRSLSGIRQKTVHAAEVRSPSSNDPVPAAGRSRLAHLLSGEHFVRTVAITPPRGGDAKQALELVRQLQARGVDAVAIGDGPRGSSCMSALAFSVLVQREIGYEAVLRYTCGDRSLIAIQAELLGAHALGLRNLSLSTGEPIRIGEYLDATAVIDVDALGVMHLVSSLDSGQDIGGRNIGPTAFYAGVLADPGAPDCEEEMRDLRKKLDAGARFVITAPVFCPDAVERLLSVTAERQIPVVASIRPVVTLEEAESLRNEIPGATVPDLLLARLSHAGSAERELREGVEAARETLGALRPMVQGIEVIAPAGRIELALEILGL
jgi:methionine synthase / methylenetetrahydrofolate reductase(NADPH)